MQLESNIVKIPKRENKKKCQGFFKKNRRFYIERITNYHIRE